MQRFLVSLIVAGAIAGVPVSASAAASKPRYTVVGIGTESCAAWLQARRANPTSIKAGLMFAWVQGLLTGFNAWGPANLSDARVVADIQRQKVWLNNYCTANPRNNLGAAAVSLATALQKRAGK